MELYSVTVKGYEFVENKRKKIRKTYIVEAFNLTDVDATMAEILEHNPDWEEPQILGAKLVSYNEIFSKKDSEYSDPKWYKCKLSITDFATGKTSKNVMLVKSDSLQGAVSDLRIFMNDTVGDWTSVAAEETNIYDVCKKSLS